jgi:hypothetical protein
VLVTDEGLGIIAIAGTQITSIGDWASNLQTRPRTLAGAYVVHTGFAKSAEQVLRMVLSELDLHECFANGNYFITGHSLGGATAAILPVLIDQASDPRIEVPKGVVAFGSPNYMSGDCGLLWPCSLVHVQSPYDIVSHVPFGVRRRWSKAGEQLYISKEGFSSHSGHQVLRMFKYVFRFFTGAWMRGRLHTIEEHSMYLYRRRILSALQKLKNKRERLNAA